MARWDDVELIGASMGHLGLALAEQEPPDLVLLDVHLPDMSGEEVLEHLRASAGTASVPVIVLSADATSAHKARMLAAGADAYLTKPLDLPHLLDLVATKLSETTAPAR